MSIPLPLGMPPSREEPRGLLDGLLGCRYTSVAAARAATGPGLAAPIVPAAAVDGPPGLPLVLDLDASAPPPAPSGWRPVRYQLDCSAADLDAVSAFTAPAPLAVYVDVDDRALADTARTLTDAGHIPGLPLGHGPDAVADFLSVLAHADTGYVARAADGDEVLALLSATAAALSGFDVRGALADPDPERLRRLVPDAAAALREILLAVEVADPAAVLGVLAGHGLAPR